MAEWVERTMNQLGYIGVVWLMFLENVFPPIPSELVMALAGFSTRSGEMTLLGVIIAGTLGSVLGAIPIYLVGALVGEERLVVLADKYGKWLTLSGKDIRRADDWFDKHGAKTVFFCRMVPGVRSLISIPAGLAHMNFIQFLLYTTVGAAIWTAFLAMLGAFLGNNYELVDEYIGPLSYVIVGGLLLAAIVWIVLRKRRQAAART
jgi:membrane protein DedA with SNARE-associated domain